MTVINRYQEPVVLHQHHVDDLWTTFQTHFAGDDQQRWKGLAMLALHENLGWTHEQIGYAFGHPRGHVSRCVQLVKRQLRAQFALAPDAFASADDEGFSDPQRPE
jgi:hypothetical protein